MVAVEVAQQRVLQNCLVQKEELPLNTAKPWGLDCANKSGHADHCSKEGQKSVASKASDWRTHYVRLVA